MFTITISQLPMSSPQVSCHARALKCSAHLREEANIFLHALITLTDFPEDHTSPEWEQCAQRFNVDFVYSMLDKHKSPPQPTEQQALALRDLTHNGEIRHFGAGAVASIVLCFMDVMRDMVPASQLTDPQARTRIRAAWQPLVAHCSLAPESKQKWRELKRHASINAKASEWWVGEIELSSHAMASKNGDACFTFVDQSQHDTWTHEELVRAAMAKGASFIKGSKAAVQIQRKSPVHIHHLGTRDNLVLWKKGRKLLEISFPPLAFVRWDSRMFCADVPFRKKTAESIVRVAKHISYIDTERHGRHANHTVMRDRFLSMISAHGSCMFELKDLPVADTTDRFGREYQPPANPTPTMRKVMRAVDHPLIRPFFTLPHIVARALIIFGFTHSCDVRTTVDETYKFLDYRRVLNPAHATSEILRRSAIATVERMRALHMGLTIPL